MRSPELDVTWQQKMIDAGYIKTKYGFTKYPIYLSDIISELHKEGVIAFAPLTTIKPCINCKTLRKTIFDGTASRQLCPNCNADLTGKVYPKKRDSERVIKDVELTNDPELNLIIDDVLSNNEKSVIDYKNGKKQSVGFLVGVVLKVKKFNPAEVKLLLEKRMNAN